MLIALHVKYQCVEVYPSFNFCEILHFMKMSHYTVAHLLIIWTVID